MSLSLKNIWRAMGFGFDGAADSLRALKADTPPGQSVHWQGASNYFALDYLGTGNDLPVRAIHRDVSAALIRRANDRLIPVYSNTPDAVLPETYAASKNPVLEAAGKVMNLGLVFGNDMTLWFRTIDVIDAVLQTGELLQQKDHPLAKDYLATASRILANGAAASSLFREYGVNPAMLGSKFKGAQELFLISGAKPPEFIQLMQKCAIPVQQL